MKTDTQIIRDYIGQLPALTPRGLPSLQQEAAAALDRLSASHEALRSALEAITVAVAAPSAAPEAYCTGSKTRAIAEAFQLGRAALAQAKGSHERAEI